MICTLKYRLITSLSLLIAAQLAYAAPMTPDTVAQSNLFRSRPGSGEQPFTQDIQRQKPVSADEAATPVVPAVSSPVEPPALRLPSDVPKRSKREGSNAAKASETVSYTHLTLPTKA